MSSKILSTLSTSSVIFTLFSLRIVMAPSNHGCRRGLTDEDKALWGSWAVIGPKHRYVFSLRKIYVCGKGQGFFSY